MDDLLERVSSRANAAAAERKTKPAPSPAVRWTLPGFGPMTRISTSFGEVHAQTLRVQDAIRSERGDLRPVKWLDRMVLDSEFLRHVPDAHAVMIRAGSLGGGLPKADVVVSPQQLIGLGRHPAEVKFKKAVDLVGRPGVVRKPEEMFTYTMFHCGVPTLARVEGVWARIDP